MQKSREKKEQIASYAKEQRKEGADCFMGKNREKKEQIDTKLQAGELPRDFEERMQKLMKEEYEDFLAAYDATRLYGLRFNPLKAKRSVFLEKMPFTLEPVAWTGEGFYYKPEEQPGKHVLHEAGAYYIQEPSAMAAAEVLEPEAGERVLDLCAAPGGKSTHIAGKMQGKGLLVSNEIIPGRAKILSQNIERMGIRNAVVTNEPPERLATFFPGFFDKILVDAPCSGEGMFRKDETAVREWSLSHVQMCGERQKHILSQAAQMLKPGGVLVYSTCTFSAEENEGVISDFVREHPAFSIEQAKLAHFFEPGRKEWIENPAAHIEDTLRLWPHKIKGEGHFIARLRKDDGLLASQRAFIEETENCRSFLQDELGISASVLDEFAQNGVIIPFGEHLYLAPRQMPPLKGLKILRPGLHLCTRKKNRLEPAHALALSLAIESAGQCYEMTQEQAKCYLRGETFACGENLKGWILLATDGYSIGYGKAGGGQMKNFYPKGLRKQL